MAERFSESLQGFPVFSQASEEHLEQLEAKFGLNVTCVSSGQRISQREASISCILSGELAIYSLDEGRPVLLRYLKSGELFGAATVFHENTPISLIEATSNARILEVDQTAVTWLFHEDVGFRMAFVAFLSDRIRFLNRRIACISAGSAERKLGLWLCSLSDEDSFPLPISMSDLANLLDIGRASLYRSFHKLEELGWLKRNGTHIELLDRESILKEIY